MKTIAEGLKEMREKYNVDCETQQAAGGCGECVINEMCTIPLYEKAILEGDK